MRHRYCLTAAAVLLAGAATAGADETTFCEFFITSLPYTIETQGHYCFNANLSTAQTAGAAIFIESDFVVVDLNNFKLGGGSAGLATSAVGIEAHNHRNITIRNGNIRGFKYGILIDGTPSGGHLVENNLLDGNTHVGASVQGDSVVIRNNIVNNTGGSTTTTVDHYGLYAVQLTSLVRDNIVTNTFNSGTGAVGIGYQVMADHNVVRMGNVAAGNSTGISGGHCRDNTVVNATAGQEFFGCALVGHNYSQ